MIMNSIIVNAVVPPKLARLRTTHERVHNETRLNVARL